MTPHRYKFKATNQVQNLSRSLDIRHRGIRCAALLFLSNIWIELQHKLQRILHNLQIRPPIAKRSAVVAPTVGSKTPMNVLNKILSNLRHSVNLTMGNSTSHANESVDNGFTRGTYGDVKNSVGIQIVHREMSLYYNLLTTL